jgi:hypothetical protein
MSIDSTKVEVGMLVYLQDQLLNPGPMTNVSGECDD